MVMELPPTRDNAPYHHIIDGHGFPMAMRRRDSPFPCYLFFYLCIIFYHYAYSTISLFVFLST